MSQPNIQILKPLDAFPSIRSTNIDYVSNFVKSTLNAGDIKFHTKDKLIDLRANCYDTKTSSLWFCSYGAPLKIQFPVIDSYRIQFHYSGKGLTKTRDQEIDISPDQACISSDKTEIDFGNNFQQLALRFKAEALLAKLAILCDVGLIQDLEFDPILDLTQPSGSRTKALLDLYVSSIETKAPPHF